MPPDEWSRADVVDQQAVDGLVRLLDLEQLELNLFRGVSPDVKVQRVFGGQVAGQALVAAGRSVDPEHGTVHSLHAYFLRPGDPSIPIVYEVDRIRDGRSFTTRRVVAIQHGKAIFNLAASFHRDEPGLEHQAPMPSDLRSPQELPTFKERWAGRAEQLGEWYTRPAPDRHPPCRCRRPTITQIPGHEFALEFEPDNEEEDGQQSVGGPRRDAELQMQCASGPISNSDIARYVCDHGEFAHTSAAPAATSSSTPPTVSLRRISENRCVSTTSRASGVASGAGIG